MEFKGGKYCGWVVYYLALAMMSVVILTYGLGYAIIWGVELEDKIMEVEHNGYQL